MSIETQHPTTSAATLADVIAHVAGDADITKTQRRDRISAINRLCTYAGVTPGDTPAEVSSIRSLLKELAPAACDVTPASFQNMIRLVDHSMKRYRPAEYQPHRGTKTPLTPEWAALLASCPDKYIRIGLSRFGRFCGKHGWAPNDVTSEHVAQFTKMLEQEVLGSRHTASAEAAVTAWNRAVESVPGWPQQRLTRAIKKRAYTFHSSAFPESFQKDLEAYVKSRSEVDLTNPERQRILRPRTLVQNRDNVRQLASALVLTGTPIETITSLSVLVQPEMAKRAMTFYYERAGKKITAQNHRLAGQLLTLGTQWCQADAPTLATLKTIRSKLYYKQNGLSEKNRRRLVNFEDPKVLKRILNLPKTLEALAKQTQHPLHAASLMRMAVCVELLLHRPIRLANLVSIDMKRHIIRSTPGPKGKVHLVLPAHEVKNCVDLTSELPPEVMRLINLYIGKYRSAFTDKPTSLLLPAKSGNAVLYVTLGRAISHITKKFVGVRMNPHLFRHFAALLWLKERPENYEILRRVLGHTSINTTTKFYAGLETTVAMRLFDENILGYRSGRASRPVKGK